MRRQAHKTVPGIMEVGIGVVNGGARLVPRAAVVPAKAQFSNQKADAVLQNTHKDRQGDLY